MQCFWSEGTEVVALYNFDGKSLEDLPFRRGDVLTITRRTLDPNWYHAQRADGKSGMLPANYVKQRTEVRLDTMPWYHGSIHRGEAERLLSDSGGDGHFLVRESNNYPGDYALCVYSGGKVEHYHIMYKSNRFTLDEEVYFENLLKLIKHYQETADGLVCRLIEPLRKKGNGGHITIDNSKFATSGCQIELSDLKMLDQVGKGESGGFC